MPDDDTQRLMAVFARNIRRSRKSACLTQKQLAERGRMHWRYVQKVEKGEVNATLQTITRLAGALNIDPSTLLRMRLKRKAPMKRRTR